MKSSVVTVTKKTEEDDGFLVPNNKKRGRATSPKNNCYEVSTSNVFSPLEENSPPKKVVPKEEKSEENKVRSCRPKTDRFSAQVSKNSAAEKPTHRKGVGSIKTSNPKLNEKGSRKSLSKENLILHPTDTSLSKSGK